MASTISAGTSAGNAIAITGDTSGNLSLLTQNGANTITVPNGTGAMVVNGVNSPLVLGTAVASTSGTSIDFTSIPSWVKRITIMFNGVSTSGTTAVLVQIGSGSVTTSGYTASSIGFYTPSGVNTATYSTGFGMFSDQAVANRFGQMTILLQTGTTYLSSHTINSPNIVHGSFGAGGIALSGILDRVRITTVNGTDTFDAGSINIQYE
jgi:hypothetical protein